MNFVSPFVPADQVATFRAGLARKMGERGVLRVRGREERGAHSGVADIAGPYDPRTPPTSKTSA